MPKERTRNPSADRDRQTGDRHLEKRYKDYRPNFHDEEDVYARGFRDDHYADRDQIVRVNNMAFVSEKEKSRRRDYEGDEISSQRHRYANEYVLEGQFASEAMPADYFRADGSRYRRDKKKKKRSKKSRKDASKNGMNDDQHAKTVAAVKALVDYGNGTSETDSSTGESSIRTKMSSRERVQRSRGLVSEVKVGHDRQEALLAGGSYAMDYDSPLVRRERSKRARSGEPGNESRELARHELTPSEPSYLEHGSSSSRKHGRERERGRGPRSPEETMPVEYTDLTRATTSHRDRVRLARTPDLSPPDLAPATLPHGRSAQKTETLNSTSIKNDPHRRPSRSPARKSKVSAVRGASPNTETGDAVLSRDKRRRNSPTVSQSPGSTRNKLRLSPSFGNHDRDRSRPQPVESTDHRERSKAAKTSPSRKDSSKHASSPPQCLMTDSSNENSTSSPPMPVLSRMNSPRDVLRKTSPTAKRYPDEKRAGRSNSQTLKEKQLSHESLRKSQKLTETSRRPLTPAPVLEEVRYDRQTESASGQGRHSEAYKRSRPRSPSDDLRQSRRERNVKAEDVPKSYQAASSPNRKKARHDSSMLVKSLTRNAPEPNEMK